MRRIKRPKHIVKSTCTARTQAGEIEFILARSTGRRTLTITIDDNAAVSVASPFNMKEREIYDFVNEKSTWISEKVKEVQKNIEILDQKEFDHGHQFLYLGRKHTVHVDKKDIKRARISFDALLGWKVTVPHGLTRKEIQCLVKERMLKWYRAQAAEILGGRIFHYAREIGVEPKKIGIRTQKRLWGCCDYNTQTIQLNWMIILSPIKVIDYIVVHELCHLTIPNHSKRFWKKVAKFMPDFKHYQKWLKVNHLDMVLP